MVKWIQETMGRKPLLVVAVVLMMYFIYSETDKRGEIKQLKETINQKDQIIIQANIREQQLSDKLLEYAFKFQRMDNDAKSSDSLLRQKTEGQVKKILKNE